MDTVWKDPPTCCTEKKEICKDFLSFQLADLMDRSIERRHLLGADANLPIRTNHAQGI
jgi:hypothetical protein